MVILRSHSLALQEPARRTTTLAVCALSLGLSMLTWSVAALLVAGVQPDSNPTPWVQLSVAAALVVLLIVVCIYSWQASHGFGFGGVVAELGDEGVRFPSYPGARGGRFFLWRDIDHYRLVSAVAQPWWWRQMALLDRWSAPCLLIVRLRVSPRGYDQVYGGWLWRLLYTPHVVTCWLSALAGRMVSIQEGIDTGIEERRAVERLLTVMFEDEAMRTRYGDSDRLYVIEDFAETPPVTEHGNA